MIYSKDYSIIIPFRDSLHFLPKLFSSIPKDDRLEIIIVDNTPLPISKEQILNIGINHQFNLYYSEPSRGAGGARNVGISVAKGKWLLFLDADDYFADSAFDAFYKHFNTDAEIVYFCMDGVYADTGKKSDRGDRYTNSVINYINGLSDEMSLRLGYSSPCAKMVSHDLVKRENLRYDEVIASNDTIFSMLSGYYAKKIEADLTVVYIATVSKGSLTRRRDINVILSRYQVALRFNRFLKDHKLNSHQKSVMVYFYDCRHYGISVVWKMMKLAIKYRQNIFIGAFRWYKTLKKKKKVELKDSVYITK